MKKAWFVIDQKGWAFDLYATGLKKALVRYGWDLEVAAGPPPVGFAGPILCSYWPALLKHLEGHPRRQIFCGVFSHWELRDVRSPAVVAAVRDCRGVFAPNDELLTLAERTFENDNGYCLPGGIDTDVYTPAEAPPERFTVGWCGNAAMDVKRFDWALQVADRTGARLHAVGMGRGLRQLPLDRMPDFYRGVSVHLMTSSEDAGPWCLHEALACGVPVVGTRVGLAPAMITGMGCGRLVDDIDQMVKAVELFRDSPEAMAYGRNRARAVIERDWSWNVMGERFNRMISVPPWD